VTDGSKSSLPPLLPRVNGLVGPPSTHLVRHESQVIGKPSERASQTEHITIFTPSRSDDDRQMREDLAPAQGVLAGLFIGGVMWLLIICALSCVS
jgi:hypothetical protein